MQHEDDERPPQLPGEDEEPAPTEPFGFETDESGYTTSDFHNVIQKQVLNATYETLVESKFHWELVEPFLHAAREMCLGDFRRTGRIQIHGIVAEGDGWTDAEEAYVGLSIADQDDGREWLSQTWWLSDLVLGTGDPAQVREAARALERTVAKLDSWLAEHDKGPDEAG
jgi:hypothetical protein